ncbi:MAG: polyprenyl synthetase family protein, partial [Cocleimonas sp.]|nr:polyprenyl synthetase family protein [Cocleimonas sp.]
YSKTAKLFEAACQLGAVLSKLPKEEESAVAQYGIHLGTAFQLVDDILDYSASAAEMGKNIGDDLAEGKPTLPLIIALQRSTGDDEQLIRHAIEEGGLDKIDEVMQIIKKTKALEYSADIAKNEVKRANACLSCLQSSDYKKALESLSWFSIERAY